MVNEEELHHGFLREAFALAHHSVAQGGGPFAAVVVRGDEVVGRGHNRVTLDNDPTAHAEIVAIRDACRNLGTFVLAGCRIYVSCEPCPMCLSAIFWARLEGVWFAAAAADAAAAGFDDVAVYRELALPREARAIPQLQLLREESLAVFAAWREKGDRVEY